MLIKLLKNIEQGGGIKVSRRRIGPYNQAIAQIQAGVIKAEAAQQVLDAARKQVVEVVFAEGAVIEMSAASAQKYIDAGLGEAYVEPAQPAQ